jgi:phthalate 4,5-dioxygenase
LHQQVGVDLDREYRPFRNDQNRFWQDRAAMAAGNFTGIRGFPNQDIAMWVTMGPIANRSGERLGASDIAIVEFRRRMLDAIQEFEAGGSAIGAGDLAVPAGVRSYQAIVSKETDWRHYTPALAEEPNRARQGSERALNDQISK